MNEFLKLLTESPDNEALVKMLTQGMQGSVKSNDIGGNLLKTGLSTAGTAAFGPIGGVAGTVLGQLLVPNKQEPQPINPRVQRNLNPYGMATGGMVQNGQGLVPVEVEGDEMFELPNGQVGEFQGPDHEQGGIPTQLPPGTNVYSKRMTGADGRSMADRKESRERRLRKILAQLDKRPTDAPTINSVSREVNRIQAEEEQDMQIMQMYQLRDMLAQARQGQMQGQMSPEMMQQQQMQQGQMSPEMMQGQMPQEMMQGEMPMMRGGGKVDPRLGTGRDMANINKVAPEVAPNQIDLIHQYHKGKGDVYQILDKAGGKRTFYRDGEELFTHPVLVGANEGDDPTMTVLNEGGVDWEAGNKMTGAGVFEVSEAQKRNSNYQNAPFYVYKNVATGKNIRSSDHAVLGSRRARLQDDDFTNNRMTNGCVNANCDDLKEVYNAGYGVGNRRYVLPEDGYNYFDMEDGEIVMKTRYTGGDLPEVTVTAERPSVIGMSPQLVEMPRESTAVNMPMMQAGGVIRNGNTMNGFTDLAMLLGGYNKMQSGGEVISFNNKEQAQEFLQTIDINSPALTEEDKANITNALETLGYDMTPSPELTTTQVDQFGRQETAIDPFETIVKPAYNEWDSQQPGFTGYGLDGELMPSTELATGTPGSEVGTDFLPNEQPQEEGETPRWQIDPLTQAGYITSGAGPLVTTILNRLGDEPTPNFYANFGRDAERVLDAAERGIAGSRDRAYEENRLAQNLRGRQARNAARSSNVMQAMQQAALTSGMKANEQITGQYQNALRALLANRAQFEQGQDQAIMKGREAAYTADLQNRDQFSTNLASNLANAGSMMQTLGRQKEIFDIYNQLGGNLGNLAKQQLDYTESLLYPKDKKDKD